MGWTSQDGMTRAQAIQEVRRVYNYQDGTVGVAIASTFLSGCDWQVREYQRAGIPCERNGATRFIVGVLIECQRHRGMPAGAAWKEVDEEMGPCRYDCPLRFLDMVPQPIGGYAGPWRAKVRAWHAVQSACRKRTIEVGRTYALLRSVSTVVRITSLKPLLGIADNGLRYRIPRARLGEPIA